MKIAIVCDYLNTYGGGERVLESLLEIYPEADIFTSLYDPLRFSLESPIRKAKVTGILPFQFSIFNSQFLKHLTFLMPFFFERIDLSGYDLIISVGTIWSKAIRNYPKHSRHIFYCLTPPRFLYGYPSETSKRNVWYYRPFTTLLDHALRIWDFNAAQKPDRIISISKEIQKRVKKFYRRESVVIYPPVVVSFNRHPELPRGAKDLDSSGRTPQNDAGGRKYFLIVSRLAAYKRIDAAIRACQELGLSLKIVGTGREEKKLKQMAGPTVEFLGFRTDEEINRIYEGAKALIFPTPNEDFGIVPLEANAHGVPVIANKSGGPLETLVEGKTAVFFNDFGELKKILKDFDESKFSAEDCRQNAQRFSKEGFRNEFKRFVDELG